jgi:leucyl-tRNA synthetase
LGFTALLADTAWPEADESLLTDENVTIAVQVNGKLRGTIELAKDAAQEDAEAAALQLPRVREALENKPPRKVIVVPNRIINVVV